MKTVVHKILSAAIIGMSCQQASAINIQFDYSLDTNNFFGASGSIQRTILETAGSFFASNLNDSLAAITPSSGNSYDANFFHPATGASHSVTDLSVAADTLIVFAGGRSLSGSTLGQGGPGGFNIPGATSQAFVDSVVGRGQAGALGAPFNQTDFGAWGGAITFDTDASTTWYFDPDLSTSADVADSDFFSIALHELGHLLGIGTANSWGNLVSNADTFTGAASTSVFGGDVPLSSDLGHWATGTTGLVNGVPQEAVMDPSILNGTRKVFTDLDLAGLTDVGWEVSATAVPVPAAVWLFGSGLMGLVITARRRS